MRPRHIRFGGPNTSGLGRLRDLPPVAVSDCFRRGGAILDPFGRRWLSLIKGIERPARHCAASTLWISGVGRIRPICCHSLDDDQGNDREDEAACDHENSPRAIKGAHEPSSRQHDRCGRNVRMAAKLGDWPELRRCRSNSGHRQDGHHHRDRNNQLHRSSQAAPTEPTPYAVIRCERLVDARREASGCGYAATGALCPLRPRGRGRTGIGRGVGRLRSAAIRRSGLSRGLLHALLPARLFGLRYLRRDRQGRCQTGCGLALPEG